MNDYFTSVFDVSNPPKYDIKVISQQSELALAKMLLRNSTLKFLLVSQNAHMPTPFTFHDHHECPMFRMSELSTTFLLSTCASEFYYRIKLSSIIRTVEIPTISELGHDRSCFYIGTLPFSNWG